jgi:ADP-heptose:LPS heptosyltransferase
LTPRALGALLRKARAYVGNDSGVSHLAAAFGAPSIVLFGPTDPRVWAPLGPRVRTLRAPDGRLEQIEVAEVLGLLREWAASFPDPGGQRSVGES